jgi:hypothetical protein
MYKRLGRFKRAGLFRTGIVVVMAAPYFRYNPDLDRVEIGPGFDGGGVAEQPIAGTTAGAVSLVLVSIAVAPGQGASISATAFVRNAGAAASATAGLNARVRNVGGTISITVDVANASVDPPLDGVALSLEAAADGVNLVAVGVPGQDLAWAGAARVLRA